MDSKRLRVRAIGVGFGVMILTVSGCLSISELAPPVEPWLVEAGGEVGHEESQLLAGREIYLSRCIECHGVLSVHKYTLSQWRTILPGMSERSGLNAQEQESVLAYVEAVHALPDSEPPAR